MDNQDIIIRPRLNDFYGIPMCQENVDFAIPFLNEDIPLYLDPFLMWKSCSFQDKALHSLLINNFNGLGRLFMKGNQKDACHTLMFASECDEVGLGNSCNKSGKRFGEEKARSVLSLFQQIQQIQENGFSHFEEIQLLVDGVAKDRISDIACNLTNSFLIDYTMDCCKSYNIPTHNVTMSVFDSDSLSFKKEQVQLPTNPNTNQPILFVPKRWLRKLPWLNPDDYITNFYQTEVQQVSDKGYVLRYNRNNYGQIQRYTAIKERSAIDCVNDSLFTQIPVLSMKRKMKAIESLASGRIRNADKEYERLIAPMLASLFYPHLDFAQTQCRTLDGVQIRDLIFYNNISETFFKEIYDTYDAKQLVFEMKNVNKLERDHINQLNRYMCNSFGRFGVIVTRNEPDKAIKKNIIDLWAGQRRCILVLTDNDLHKMVEMFESKQRLPYEYLKYKYIQFTRSLPS